MYLPIYLENRDVNDAQALIAQFGNAADSEAAQRARKSRNLGNHIQFCRWRQIERLIAMMKTEVAVGTIH